jgi:hypothetical protein
MSSLDFVIKLLNKYTWNGFPNLSLLFYHLPLTKHCY